MRIFLLLAAVLCAPWSVFAVTIDTVVVGNPSNTPDLQPQGLFGRVTTTYRIGVTEITNTQYAEFLNAVADADPYSLYHSNMGFSTKGGIVRSGSSGNYMYSVKSDVLVEDPEGNYTYTYGDKPVVFVTWYDSIRFANWLHNGQGAGSTETGAYTLLGGTATPSNADSISRLAGAKWFLPTENEWYKAAYFNGTSGVYFDYPTGTDTAPDNNLPVDDTGNSANFLVGVDTTTGNLDYPYTDAGEYALSESPYGTFDQAGNVWEWNETLISAGMRGRRGGAWSTDATTLVASHQGSNTASFATESIGFRVASILDPSGLPGDFNGNGTVDAADYVIWRKNNGTVQQYNEWRANFGATSPGGGSIESASRVPEPSTWIFLAIGAASMFSFRRPFRGRAICR